ncbi:antistasin [Biomphalaria glabrata]|nr:antistasin-like [Biomphalaria glabrata]
MRLLVCLALTVFVSVTLSAPSFKRGFCLSLCGSVNNVTCPSGYECRSNGCGHQCYKTTFVQPAGCSELVCAVNCPLGYARTDQGCEICQCDYSRLGEFN